MATNYPAALDTTTNQPVASALSGVELDGDGNANKVHSTLHGTHSEAIVAIETKIGTGASTAVANRVLRGTGTGTSAWAQVGLTTDVTGTLPLANGGTGATALTNLITLGTHSTGNYLATLANATNGGTTIANSGSETAAATVAMNLNDLSAGTMADGDSIAFIDADDSNATKKEALADLLDTVAGTVATTGLDRSGATLVVTDLHPVGVSGSANQLLTDDGDGTVTSESNLTFDGSALSLGDTGQVVFTDDVPSSDHTATGVIVKITSSSTLARGVPVYINGSGTVTAADADAATSMPAIGINTTDLSGGAGEAAILLLGIWKDETYNFTVGADLFVGLDPASSTANSDGLGITTTAPTAAGDTVQKVGVVLTVDKIFVNFNTTEILLA